MNGNLKRVAVFLRKFTIVMSFGKLRNLISRFEQLNQTELMHTVLNDADIQNEAIRLNTEVQLYDKGVDSLGGFLGSYSPVTVFYKKFVAPELGNDSRTDHITLKDTGDFYRSFRFDNKPNSFSIFANTLKDGKDLNARFPNILGLTIESKGNIIPEVRSELRVLLRKRIKA